MDLVMLMEDRRYGWPWGVALASDGEFCSQPRCGICTPERVRGLLWNW